MRRGPTRQRASSVSPVPAKQSVAGVNRALLARFSRAFGLRRRSGRQPVPHGCVERLRALHGDHVATPRNNDQAASRNSRSHVTVHFRRAQRVLFTRADKRRASDGRKQFGIIRPCAPRAYRRDAARIRDRRGHPDHARSQEIGGRRAADGQEHRRALDIVGGRRPRAATSLTRSCKRGALAGFPG